MEELLKFVLEKLSEKPDEIKVTQSEENSEIVFTIEASDEDKGRIIGKGGKNIKAIRDIVSVIARKEGKRIYLKVE